MYTLEPTSPSTFLMIDLVFWFKCIFSPTGGSDKHHKIKNGVMAKSMCLSIQICPLIPIWPVHVATQCQENHHRWCRKCKVLTLDSPSNFHQLECRFVFIVQKIISFFYKECWYFYAMKPFTNTVRLHLFPKHSILPKKYRYVSFSKAASVLQNCWRHKCYRIMTQRCRQYFACCSPHYVNDASDWDANQRVN